MDKKIRILFEKSKIPVIIIGCFLIVGVALLIGRSLANPNSGYLRNQEVDNLSFEKANLEYENGITTFTVEVSNKSGEDYFLKNISIELTDNEGISTTLVGYIGNNLEKDESKTITASIDEDLSSSVNLKYIINK